MPKLQNPREVFYTHQPCGHVEKPAGLGTTFKTLKPIPGAFGELMGHMQAMDELMIERRKSGYGVQVVEFPDADTCIQCRCMVLETMVPSSEEEILTTAAGEPIERFALNLKGADGD